MDDSAKYLARFQRRCSWYRANFTEKRITADSGCTIRLAFQQRSGARAIVVFVTGRTEFIEKYIELAEDMQHENISLCLYDHCGQGGSGRLLADREKGHVDTFINYARDLDLVLAAAAGKKHSTPVYLVCHSMGAAVAALYCMLYRDRIGKLVLSSPMFGIRTGVYLPRYLVELMVAAACRLGFAEQYVPTTGPFKAVQPFTGNVLTSDEDRFKYNLFLNNHLEYARFGGPTLHWLEEAFSSMRAIRLSYDRIDCPVLILAGSRERVVDLREIRHFSKVAKKGMFREFQEARHELFMERDRIRNEIVKSMRNFLDYS